MNSTHRYMPDSSNRDREIFDAALELNSAAERVAYLSGACGGDGALRERVEALLRAHEQAGGFLPEDDPNPPTAPARTVRLTSGPPPVTEKPGDRVGRYKLREKIGEGGCGVVYVAEQEEPVRRRVALKIVKLGMDTQSVIARFDAERQALAMMDHPNIAKIYDAGVTGAEESQISNLKSQTHQGRPFFVMELVRGIKLTDYCDQNKLSTGERLDLFIKICQAVQHAHQKGIIHRDLKPSNILVTLHDGVPVPKIIDFGIAKATEGRLTDLTIYTELHQFIGTPAYMSPEQAEMSGLDIDTRSDIYSLGVLLYELLTGQPPFDPKELLRQGLDEIRRTIREVEPPRPSTRLSTLAAATLSDVAEHRHTEAPRLMSLIRGDLDWIVMKCLEKDRTRRYETANGLAADLRRHLNQEPVVARPPSTAYRFEKLVRRNRLVFAAGGAVAAALVLGLALSAWQAVRATKAERKEKGARETAERANARESEQRTIAEANARHARRLLYAGDMKLAHRAWEEGNLARMATLLEAQRPKAGESDERGFEYFQLQELAQGEQEQVLHSHTNAILGLMLSPNGKWLSTRSATDVRVWDLATRAVVSVWPCARRDWPEFSVSFSHDSRLMAMATDCGLQLLNPATREIREIASGAAVRALFSPATNWIAFSPTNVGDRYGLQEVIVWDYLTDQVVTKLPQAGWALAWSPDGNRLLTGAWAAELRQWDTGTWLCIAANQAGQYVSVAVASPEGGLLAAAGWARSRATSTWPALPPSEPKESTTASSAASSAATAR
jgi:serine/threonine protein kinase